MPLAFLNIFKYLLHFDTGPLQAVKVESGYPSHNRYLVVVSTIDRQDTEESVILGVDIVDDQTTIGLVLTVWGDMTIRLDGDGYVNDTVCDNFMTVSQSQSYN